MARVVEPTAATLMNAIGTQCGTRKLTGRFYNFQTAQWDHEP